MRSLKGEFCEKRDFRNVNFVQNEICENWDFQYGNSWIKCGFLLQLGVVLSRLLSGKNMSHVF